ncbi:MAG: hypothetical protein ABSG13_08560 [Bryobacteraceae bacterium]|jgi:hypothetical protein
MTLQQCQRDIHQWLIHRLPDKPRLHVLIEPSKDLPGNSCIKVTFALASAYRRMKLHPGKIQNGKAMIAGPGGEAK